jgi:hypothetical protein
MKTPKRSPEEILAALEEEDIADEVDRVAKLSGAEVDRELAHAGLSPIAIRAGANDVLERAMRKRAESHGRASGVEPIAGSSGPDISRSQVVAALARSARRGAWRRPAVWTAAAAAAASIGVLVATNAPEMVARVSTGHGAGGVETAASTSGDGDHDRAESLRKEATKACALSLWATCAAWLDEARKLDPAGESEPSVKKLREALDAASTKARGTTDGGQGR